MGRTARQAVAAARHDVAQTISRSIRALAIGIGERPEEEVKQAFNLPQKEAPQWTHAAIRLGAAQVTAEKDDKGAPVGLAIVMVGAAPSVESWEKQAESFKLAAPPKVIDAQVTSAVTPVEEPAKK